MDSKLLLDTKYCLFQKSISIILDDKISYAGYVNYMKLICFIQLTLEWPPDFALYNIIFLGCDKYITSHTCLQHYGATKQH